MERFYLDEYIEKRKLKDLSVPKEDFEAVCRFIEKEFSNEWDKSDEGEALLELQKKAIIGSKKEVEYFKRKISALLKEKGFAEIEYPFWYESIEDAIYHEIWGLSGIAQWFTQEYEESSSAKVIGNNIYFMERGKMTKKPQKISDERRQQLIRAFLLTNPKEKANKDFYEIYMADGTRITVFQNNLVKENLEVIVFRRYTVPIYTFEEQALRGTIPKEAVELFKQMVKLGFNCAFTGEVRSAKTTFLATWQSYEDKRLEGVLLETDPEIPLHRIMPDAPVMQLLADGERLDSIVKNLMRADADYFVIGEARDAVALNTALRIADRGGKRMKMTFHIRNPKEFPYDVANEIVNGLGGDIGITTLRAAAAFDFIFHFSQLENKSQKRLMGIYQMSGDKRNGDIQIDEICIYDRKSDSWLWKDTLSKEKMQRAEWESKEACDEFVRLFTKLTS